MLQLATIGTSWITSQFIEACLAEGSYQLSRVYSRTLAKAQEVVDRFGQGQAVDNLDALFGDAVDVIYVASPNLLHFDHAMAAIHHGKHVIVEKPQFVTPDQWQEAHEAAKVHGVYLFEAIRHLHTRNYQWLKQLIDQTRARMTYPFLGAAFNIGQYSSKYDAYIKAMDGEAGVSVPNIFNPEMATGTLMDIGIYPIYVALGLFGFPQKSVYHPVLGPNGSDLMGTIVLTYADFMVTLFIAKGVHSLQASEIYLGKETVIINNITDIDHIRWVNKANELLAEIHFPVANPMEDEAHYFADVLLQRTDRARYAALETLSYQVAQVMADLRQSAGLVFPEAGEATAR